jgi:hypothetical protein
MKNKFELTVSEYWNLWYEVDLFWLAGVPIVGYPLALLAHDGEWLAANFAFWAFCVVLLNVGLVWRVAWRGGQTPRAAAVLALGLAPWLLFLPPTGGLLLTRTGLTLAFPAFATWGISALVLASRRDPPARSPSVLALLLGGGAAIYALFTAAFAGAVWLTLHRAPLGDLNGIDAFAVVVCGLLGLTTAFGAAQLAFEAARRLRG